MAQATCNICIIFVCVVELVDIVYLLGFFNVPDHKSGLLWFLTTSEKFELTKAQFVYELLKYFKRQECIVWWEYHLLGNF